VKKNNGVRTDRLEKSRIVNKKKQGHEPSAEGSGTNGVTKRSQREKKGCSGERRSSMNRGEHCTKGKILRILQLARPYARKYSLWYKRNKRGSTKTSRVLTVKTPKRSTIRRSGKKRREKGILSVREASMVSPHPERRPV